MIKNLRVMGRKMEVMQDPEKRDRIRLEITKYTDIYTLQGNCPEKPDF